MIQIEQKTKVTPTRKILSVVLSIILLWGFGVSVLLVLLNLSIGFARDAADFNQSFLDAVLDKEYGRLINYITLSVKHEDAENAASFSGMLASFQSHFDPEKTNLRFSVTDSEGRLLLNNIPEGEQDEKNMLASLVRTDQFLVSSFPIRVQHHFSDPIAEYREIFSSDKSQYLEENSAFDLWYFSDTRVDEVYHQGLQAVIPSSEHTALVVFDSWDAAQNFRYADYFGEQCKWEIVGKDATHTLEISGGQSEGGAEIYHVTDGKPEKIEYNHDVIASGTAVAVRYRTDRTSLWLSLSQYYSMKNSGSEVRAEDQVLENLLTGGVDITIQADHFDWENCYLLVYLPAALSVHDRIRADYSILSAIAGGSEYYAVVMFVLLVLTAFSCVMMCRNAGHVQNSDEIRPAQIHSFAYEIFWLLPPVTFFGAAIILDILSLLEAPYRVMAIFCIGMIFCIAAACILWLYTTAVRVKTGTFWSSFGVYRLARLLLRLMFRHRAAVSAAVLLYLMLLGAGNILLVNWSIPQPQMFLFLLLDLLTLFAILYCIYAYFELRQHVRHIETGDYSAAEHPVPLRLDFAGFDRSLNSITDGVEAIVDKQLRAEHLRTELITNVSHDLKTPLTSIVNYVDLLSREPMQSEAAAEYLEVLRRQAARLKKLTVDLVDASKASTGNLTVELVPANIQVLIGQITGEYEEQLHARGLTLMQSVPDEPLTILADGRQIWRVFDNLLNNACKYAMEGTRVYLDVTADDKTVVTTLKNISALPLNISPDELMERFVRGDSSRSTEGSGLGLSIARDLTVLQNGTLDLKTDGDLFKVQLRFPRYDPEQSPKAE